MFGLRKPLLPAGTNAQMSRSTSFQSLRTLSLNSVSDAQEWKTIDYSFFDAEAESKTNEEESKLEQKAKDYMPQLVSFQDLKDREAQTTCNWFFCLDCWFKSAAK